MGLTDPWGQNPREQSEGIATEQLKGHMNG